VAADDDSQGNASALLGVHLARWLVSALRLTIKKRCHSARKKAYHLAVFVLSLWLDLSELGRSLN
jgi:hypothetical protein